MNAIDPYHPTTLASDIAQVRRIYAEFFAGLAPEDWRYPTQNGDQEWNLRQVAAHLGSLTQLGQDCAQAALKGEPAPIPQGMTRYEFNRFNRQQIEERLPLPVERLRADLLGALAQSIEMARSLSADELGRTVELPIYNRPIRAAELLGIQVVHPGLTHGAQIAEPAGRPPLWTHLPQQMLPRLIGRMIRALSLLYRSDLAGDMRATLVLKVAGPGGGSWRLGLSPDHPGSTLGDAPQPDLSWWFRDTATFCRMFTGRLNPFKGLLLGRMKLRGDLRLFLRFKTLFSVDA
jgi:uncharacterized protein (TIGR03083 family)